jgi:hypothetical protein
MAEPKYLRNLVVELDAVPNPEPFRAAQIHHIPYLLERLFMPVPSPGIGKLIVKFSPERTSPEVKDIIGVAEVWWPFALESFQQLAASERQAQYLQTLRDAVEFAAVHFSWDQTRLDSACEEIRNAGYTATCWWPAKPKFDPQRRVHARVMVEVADTSRLWIVFGDRTGELRRVLVSNLGRGANGIVFGDVLGELRWDASDAVSLFLRNGRDHWRISTGGSVEFIFPLARPDNAQGLYKLGRLYWEGQYVDVDRDRALNLMRQAAALGYKHAQRFVQNFSGRSTA